MLHCWGTDFFFLPSKSFEFCSGGQSLLQIIMSLQALLGLILSDLYCRAIWVSFPRSCFKIRFLCPACFPSLHCGLECASRQNAEAIEGSPPFASILSANVWNLWKQGFHYTLSSFLNVYHWRAGPILGCVVFDHVNWQVHFLYF